jgi:hypothetical protein
MPNLFKHLAQLAVTALNQNHFVPGIVALANLAYPGRRSPHLTRTRLALLDRHAGAQNVQLGFGRDSSHFDKIGLFHSSRGLGQLVGQFAVIGHHQQALAHVVEAPNGIEPFPHLVEELHHGRPALGILHRGHKAPR